MGLARSVSLAEPCRSKPLQVRPAKGNVTTLPTSESKSGPVAQGYHLPNCNPLESPGLSQRNLVLNGHPKPHDTYNASGSGETVSARARVINVARGSRAGNPG